MEELAYITQADISESNEEELHDPFSDANRVHKITFEDITSAAFRIKSGIVRTPCEVTAFGVDRNGYVFQKDFLQYTGSFKERGARNALLTLDEDNKRLGVISASLGNHALALSYHGFKLGIPVTVVMPIVAPIMKISQCRKYQATVVVQGRDMAEAKKIAYKLGKEHGYIYINGYDHPNIMAGQGTLGLEIAEQVPDIDAVLVPVGGGGLIAGVALAMKTLNPNVQIIGIESEKCPSFSAALKARKPVLVKSESTITDGLAVPMVGYNAFEMARPLIDKMIIVKEEWTAVAILRLIEYEKCVVEGAGAIGLAAILAGHLEELKGKRVVLNLCGGNIDTTILGRCLERGLAADGRLVKIIVTVSDRPGGIAELCKIIASIGVSIKDILHERAWVASDVFSVEVTAVCETRDAEHTFELRDLLMKNYTKIKFVDFPHVICSDIATYG